MYLVLNTAVSHSWGFPEPCDKDACGVCYHCYDCTNPGGYSTLLLLHDVCVRSHMPSYEMTFFRRAPECRVSVHTAGRHEGLQESASAHGDRLHSSIPGRVSRQAVAVLVMVYVCVHTIGRKRCIAHCRLLPR